MSVRNELLRQISVAYGGAGLSSDRNYLLNEIAASVGATVRNPNNRNMLLEDIRDAL